MGTKQNPRDIQSMGSTIKIFEDFVQCDKSKPSWRAQNLNITKRHIPVEGTFFRQIFKYQPNTNI